MSVIVVGAGPTGLLLSIALLGHGIKPVVLDSREDPDVVGHNHWSKALGVHARSLEILSALGIIDDFLASSISIKAANAFNEKGKQISTIDFIANRLESKFKMICSLPQYETEKILRKVFKERGGIIEWESKVIQLTESVESVTVSIEGKDDIQGHWVVGCDGGHSIVRRQMEISFEGEDIPSSFAMVSCKFDSSHPPDEAIVISANVLLIMLPEPNGRMRIIVPVDHEQAEILAPKPSLEYFQEICDKYLPESNCTLSDPEWLTLFKIHERLAERYRCGRVFLAGDAAHTHSPAGGQGMNTGFQDAFNLAWKLALVVKGVGTTKLIDSYSEERRPVAAALLKNSGRTTAAILPANAIVQNVRKAVISTIPHLSFLHQRMAQTIGMLDISYQESSIVKDCTIGNRGWVKIPNSSIAQVGARVPHISVNSVTGEECLFMDVCSQNQLHKLFLFCHQNSTEIQHTKKRLCRYHNYIETHLVYSEKPEGDIEDAMSILVDDEHGLATIMGMQETGYILVRPDQHISFRSSPADPVLLTEYLQQIFI